MNKLAPQVKSAQRVLELLEFFAEERRPCSVGEISRSLGYPQSSTSVLLKSLALAGYLDHDTRSGLYIPNVRIALITAWIHDRLYSEQHLLHLMEQVLTKTGHTVMIGCRKDIHVRYLHVLQSTREGRFTARIGALRPLFHSAAGKMLLSGLPQREVSLLLRKANAQAGSAEELRELPAVLQELETVRQQGYALSQGTSMPGAAALAIFLPTGQEREPLTLSVGGPMAEIQAACADLLQILREAVQPFASAVRA